MVHLGKKIALVLIASFGSLLTFSGAQAACAGLAGTWYFYDMQGNSPDIVTNFKSVLVGPQFNDRATIESFTFTNSNKGFNNNTINVITCTLKVSANGNFTAPCISYGPSGTHSASSSGHLTLSSCSFAGTVTIGGDPTPVTIRGGHVNGNVGAGIATQGSRFHKFTVVKQ